MASDDYLLVAAVDFGTTFSGYAFSFKSKPNEILMNKNWGQELGSESYKAPTCIMTKPDGSFHSFGYAAELAYSLLNPSKDKIGGADGYNLYRQFKMALHAENISLDTDIGSIQGHRMRAIDIFAMALKYLFKHMMDAIGQQLTSKPKPSEVRLVLTVPAIWRDEAKAFMREAVRKNISLDTDIGSIQGHRMRAIDIFAMALKYLFKHMMDAIGQQLTSKPKPSEVRLVLTVPAIWRDEAKAFMREAVRKAGIISEENSDNLLLALEPEAASVFCRTLELKGLGVAGKMQAYDRMLVLDAGGGTVDITFHEIQFDGNVKEVATPSGGPWGGKTVDENFVTLLEESFGTDTIDKFKHKQPQEWLKLLSSFDTAKKTFTPNESSVLRINLGYSFCIEVSMLKQKPLEDVLHGVQGVSFNNGYLVIDQNIAIGLFSGSVERIVSHVQGLLKKQKVKYILLVGGYGQCEILQDACRTHFGDKVHLLIPHEAQLAIVKGAVLFGHNPLQITSRIARFTYGTDISELFKEGVHDLAKKVIDEKGEEMCDDCFSVFITKGEEVKTGEKRTFFFSPWDKVQTATNFGLYKIDKKNVMYIDEPGVTKLGKVTLVSPSGPLGDVLEVQVTVGHTEILIEARDKAEGENFPVKTAVNFMSY